MDAITCETPNSVGNAGSIHSLGGYAGPMDTLAALTPDMTKEAHQTMTDVRSKSERIAAIAALRTQLAALFPAAIVAKGGAKRPLAIGIRHQLRERLPDVNRADLAAMLTDYCGRPTYLEAMVEGAVRVDLDGLPAGHVDAGAAAHAANRLRGIMNARRRKARIAELEAALDVLLHVISEEEAEANALGRHSPFSTSLRKAVKDASTVLGRPPAGERTAA